jgi:hypothetical protein
MRDIVSVLVPDTIDEEGGHPFRQSIGTMVLFQAPSLLSVY